MTDQTSTSSRRWLGPAAVMLAAFLCFGLAGQASAHQLTNYKITPSPQEIQQLIELEQNAASKAQASPATQPADSGNSLTVGAADPAIDAKPDLVAKWFSQLDDADPAVREEGFNKLMSLSSTDLDMLKGVVKKSLPLRPGQIAALPVIVKQLYLAGMDYEGDAAAGFMGVSLVDRDGPQFINPQINMPPPIGEPHVGIMLGHCMAGFGGARLLRDGDVVLSIIERPEVKLDSIRIFAETVGHFGVGQVIHLTVLRQNKVIRVPVTLDAKPTELEPPAQPDMAVQEMQRRRDDAAEKYWSDDFAPLFIAGAA